MNSFLCSILDVRTAICRRCCQRVSLFRRRSLEIAHTSASFRIGGEANRRSSLPNEILWWMTLYHSTAGQHNIYFIYRTLGWQAHRYVGLHKQARAVGIRLREKKIQQLQPGRVKTNMDDTDSSSTNKQTNNQNQTTKTNQPKPAIQQVCDPAPFFSPTINHLFRQSLS